MKQTKKQMFDITKRALSVFLVFLMLISVFPAVNITASATDRVVYFKNTNGFSTVNAYAWDSNNGNYKHLDEWPGREMTRVRNSDYYKIEVNSAANWIIFNGGKNADKTEDLALPSGNNPVYENGTWKMNFNENTLLSEEIVVSDSYDAETTCNFGPNIFAANATYFDYISDQEMSNGYLQPIQAGTEFNLSANNWYPFYKFNRVVKRVADSNGSWQYPLYFGNFCNVRGAYDGHNHGGDFLNAIDSWNNVSRFTYFVNNSNRGYMENGVLYDRGITAPNEVVQGLVNNKLSNGSLMATNGLKMPYFDTDFLRQTYNNDGYYDAGGHRIAKVYKSYFPFRVNQYNGCTTYAFDSTNANDNVYFTWNGTTPTAVNYASGTGYGVQDGLKYFMSQKDLDADPTVKLPAYGIFPFNNANGNNKGYKANNGNENLNYGFGVRIDIDFKVPAYGTLDGTPNGQPIMFNFSGDDDIWVFISDDNGNENLVLDLGGNHKMASGRINFKTLDATADRVFNKNTFGSLGAQTVKFNGGNHLNPNRIYHMSVFYMERGLIESNFKMDFTFRPVDNLFTTNKIVDTADVNSGIKDEVAKVDSFTITNTNTSENSAIANKAFTLDGEDKTTNGSGSYQIKHGQTAEFTNIAKVGSMLKVAESIPESIYKYSTSYVVTDVANSGRVVDKGNTLTTNAFKFQNTVTARQTTNFNVTYYNKPITSSLSLTKKAVKASNGETVDTQMSFPFTILLDLDGAGTAYDYKPYQLQYSISGEAGTYTTDKNAKFSIKAGQTLVFDGLPVNASYKFVEKVNEDAYTSEYTNNTYVGTIHEASRNNEVTFTNKLINSEPTYVALGAKKLLDEQSDFKQTFSFTLQEVDAAGNKIGTAQTKHNVNKTEAGAGNVIEFDAIEITKQSSNFVPKTMYVYGNGSTGSKWMNGVNNNPSANANAMQQVAEGVYEITFNNVAKGDNYTYAFSADGTTTHTWDCQGMFNGNNNIPLNVPEDNSVVTLQIDVSDFDFSNNSGDVTVTRTITPPDKASKKIYFDNKAGWSTVYIHYWKSGAPNSSSWPGEPMTRVSGTLYEAVIPDGMEGIVFNANKSPQTADLSVKYGYTYDNKSNTWSNEPTMIPGIPSTTSSTASNMAKTLAYSRYFEIAEVPDACVNTNVGDSFVYDSNKYYAVIDVSQSGSKITATTEYYKTLKDAVNGTATGKVKDITFHNYHDKGRMTITKVDNNGQPIKDDVKFALYKVAKDGDDISGLTPVATQTVLDGLAIFDNLDVYVSKGNYTESNYQWYCVVEIESKNGYAINSTKHYFMIPEVTETKDVKSDFEINGKKYNYVLKNGERIFNIKYRVVNAPLVVPHASGLGTAGFIYTGLSIIAIGATFFGIEMLVNRKKRRADLKN